MKAYVYFWDGFEFGPLIVTDSEDLAGRLRRVLSLQGDGRTPSQISAHFIAYAMWEKHEVSVRNASPARTPGQYLQAAESEAGWPASPMAYGNLGRATWEAGVFIVDTTNGNLRITGGLGFEKNVDDCNPNALRESNLLEGTSVNAD